MNPFLLKTAKTTNMSGGTETAMLQTLLYELNEEAGYVFAVYYIEGRSSGARDQIAIAVNDHIDRFRQTTTGGMNIARRFEHMLQALNEELATIGQDFQRIPLSHLHCVFGVITANQLYLSGIGDLIVQYMHRTNKSRYTIYDLHKQFEPVEATTWDKIFVTVLDGELHGDDVFYVATPLPNREISEAEIQDILATLPPAGALKRIEQHAGPQQPYGGICVRIEAPRADAVKKKINPISSLEQLTSTKDETAHILGEQQGNFLQTLHGYVNPLISKLHKPGERNLGAILKQMLRLALKFFLLFAQFLAFVARRTAPYLKRAWAGITSDRTKSHVRGAVGQLGTLGKKARTASKRTYLAIGIVVVLAFFVMSGVRSLAQNGERQEQIAQIREIEAIAIEKRDQASARLIFNDRDTAQSLLTEAVSLLDGLPQVRSEQERLQTLRASVMTLLGTTRGILAPDFTELAKVPEQVVGGAYGGDAIHALGQSGIVYKFNSVTSAFDVSASEQSALGSLVDIIADEKTAYVIDENQQLGTVNSSGTIASTISGLNRLEDVGALGLYNDTLYALTNNLQQLFRFRRQGGGFDGGTAWIISKDANLTNARDIAIDGDIYVLLPNALTRFTSGRQTSFALATVEPKLENATQVVTHFGGKHIYILEPSEERIVVYGKDGVFVNQYIADEFGGASTIMIDEGRRTAYALVNDRLISFPLAHLLE